MKVLKENVFIGKKCFLSKETTKGEIKYEILEDSHIFIKIGENEFCEIEDLYEVSKGLRTVLNKNSTLDDLPIRYSDIPTQPCKIFVKDLKPFFKGIQSKDEAISVKKLIQLAKNDQSHSENIL